MNGRAQPNGTLLYAELTGAWGWTCPVCRAESRYAYGDREDAVRLANRHKCRGFPARRRNRGVGARSR